MAYKFTTLVTFVSVLSLISGSAIPIWEYLSKDEKMAYLYNMFATQVEEVCNGPKFEECTKDLLKYGLKNLHDMPEDHLDAMDPYQRGANSMIWKSMMDGHSMMTKKEFTTQSPEQDIYDTFPESNYLGSASSHQETVLHVNGNAVTRPVHQQSTSAGVGVHYPYGAVFVRPETSTKTSYGPSGVKFSEDGVHYIRTGAPDRVETSTKTSYGPSGVKLEGRPVFSGDGVHYITETTTKASKSHYGPMVVKVHLDGRPVQEEKSLPADDDIHHHHIVKTKVPTLQNFERNTVYRNSPYPYAVYTRSSRR